MVSEMVHRQLDYWISSAPRGSVAVSLQIPRSYYEILIETPLVEVTLNGSDETLQRMYEREFPERLVWYDTMNGPGWEVGPAVTEHQRQLKRERGIRLYRGIPLVVTDEDVDVVRVQYETIEALVRGPIERAS